MNVFLDTNIYLNFYHFTSDDLDELKKLFILQESKKLNVYITEQVKNEFLRNRENKLFDALKKFNEDNIKETIPNIIKEYQEDYENYKKVIVKFKELKNFIKNKISNDISNNNLKADKLIEYIFNKSIKFEFNDYIFNEAKKRFDLGNPPGKDKSYGDAINWLSLLNFINYTEDIYIITDDTDFYSIIDKNKINDFLLKEWILLKKSNIFIYKNISDFIKDKYPEFKLNNEYIKRLFIDGLKNSHNFLETHNIISNLNKFSYFSLEEAENILLYSLENSQVCMIISDDDIRLFLEKIIDANKDNIDENLINKIYTEISTRLITSDPSDWE